MRKTPVARWFRESGLVALAQRQLDLKERFNTLPEPAPCFFLCCRNSGFHESVNCGVWTCRGDVRLIKLQNFDMYGRAIRCDAAAGACFLE